MACKEDVTKHIVESSKVLGVELKEMQMQAILEFVGGRDTFVSLPTGYGKSLIYGILPYVFNRLRGISNSTVVCISPLTSLMLDQRAKFASLGLSAEIVGEAQEDKEAVKKVLKGEYRIVFITPESIMNNSKFRNMLLSDAYKNQLVALAVDEAHCVKTWGDKFRVAFSKIGQLRSLLPVGVNVLALTATATMETYHIVCERLSMDDPCLIAIPPCRDNIRYFIRLKIGLENLASLLSERLIQEGLECPKTVVFVRQYADCSNLYLSIWSKAGAKFTEPPGYPDHFKFRLVDMYSRISTTEKKEQILSTFLCKESLLRIMITTTSFSMGIDCPDIATIMHWGIPSTLEEYVQETGRAGRDGRQADAILYRGKGGRHASKEVKAFLENNSTCRRKLLFEGFLKYYAEDSKVGGCKCCDVCGRECECEECADTASQIAIGTDCIEDDDHEEGDHEDGGHEGDHEEGDEDEEFWKGISEEMDTL